MTSVDPVNKIRNEEPSIMIIKIKKLLASELRLRLS